ncbi:MAG: hypothetical protein J6T38_05270 [Bacteroidaceae bacterium]|nr:hypothetical protein [Bacteroidaceae bacterium]
MMKKTTDWARTILFVLLALFTTVMAWADKVNYLDPTADVESQMKSVDATAITSTTKTLGVAGKETWYYASGEENNAYRIEVKGTVNLILVDQCNFSISAGLHVPETSSLNIYAQSVGDNRGRLVATSSGGNACIGGNEGASHAGKGDKGENAGNITFYGGMIDAGNIGGGKGGYGYYYEDEIGIGGDGGDGGTITIYGGNVNATTIGGGQGGEGDNEFNYDYGAAEIYLTWTSSTDIIRSWAFNGAVQLMKTFCEEYNEDNIFPAGSERDISNTNLMPPIKAITTQAPTCTEVGYMQNCWCNFVDKTYFSDINCTIPLKKFDVEIPPLGHDIEHTEGKAATFTKAGNIEYWYCSRCKKYFIDEEFNQEVESTDFTFEVKGNASDGYYVLMPKGGKAQLTIDKSVTSFKIYDDGGLGGSDKEESAEGNYSDDCDGYLVLAAPSGKTLQLTGTLLTEFCDELTVYAGTTTNDYKLLPGKGGNTEWIDDESYPDGGYTKAFPDDIGTILGNNLMLNFQSDGSVNFAGLDLAVKVIDAKTHPITLQQKDGGTIYGPASTQYGEVVTLTATPKNDYLLSGITVKDAANNPVEVEGGVWYNNTAIFIMPNSAVIVTPTFTKNKTGLSINMPKEGSLTVMLPADVTSFKIYDDGGEADNYSEECDGSLVLMAPDNYSIQLTGEVLTEPNCDYLEIYQGTTINEDNFITSIWSNYPEEADADPLPADIGTIIGNCLTLKFHSDYNRNYAGLDLTATLKSDAELVDIQSIQPNDTDSAEQWYTLSGTKLEGKPTAPGIYIVNGRKVMVK